MKVIKLTPRQTLPPIKCRKCGGYHRTWAAAQACRGGAFIIEPLSNPEGGAE